MGEGNADLRFLEAYRSVEIFLRGMYGGTGGEGVERYLEQMRTNGMPTARGSAYANLKHWRHLRNEFVHVRSGVCTEKDVAAVEEFHARLLCAEDPLAEAAGHHSRETVQPAANIAPPVMQQPSAAVPPPSATVMDMPPYAMEAYKTTPIAAAFPQAADGVPSRETGARQKPSCPAVRREKRQGAGRYAGWALVFGILAALGGATLLYALGYFLRH